MNHRLQEAANLLAADLHAVNARIDGLRDRCQLVQRSLDLLALLGIEPVDDPDVPVADTADTNRLSAATAALLEQMVAIPTSVDCTIHTDRTPPPPSGERVPVATVTAAQRGGRPTKWDYAEVATLARATIAAGGSATTAICERYGVLPKQARQMIHRARHFGHDIPTQPVTPARTEAASEARRARPPRPSKSKYDRAEIAGVACRAHASGLSMYREVAARFAVSETMASFLISSARKQGHDIPRIAGKRASRAVSTGPVPAEDLPALDVDVDLADVASTARQVMSSSKAQEQAVEKRFGVTTGMAIILLARARRAGHDIPYPKRISEPKAAASSSAQAPPPGPWTTEPISKTPVDHQAARDAAAGEVQTVPANQQVGWARPVQRPQPAAKPEKWSREMVEEALAAEAAEAAEMAEMAATDHGVVAS